MLGVESDVARSPDDVELQVEKARLAGVENAQPEATGLHRGDRVDRPRWRASYRRTSRPRLTGRAWGGRSVRAPNARARKCAGTTSCQRLWVLGPYIRTDEDS